MIEFPACLVQVRETRLPSLESLHRMEKPELKPEDHERAEQNEPALLGRWHDSTSPGQNSESQFYLCLQTMTYDEYDTDSVTRDGRCTAGSLGELIRATTCDE